jgi:4-hydroxy-3-polyprenylbenzoate decarboxylase
MDEEERTAFLFETSPFNGRKYNVPVLVAALAGSSQIYAAGMMCKVEEIGSKWTKAQLEPILPRLVEMGPAQEEVHTGSELVEMGLDEFRLG